MGAKACAECHAEQARRQTTPSPADTERRGGQTIRLDPAPQEGVGLGQAGRVETECFRSGDRQLRHDPAPERRFRFQLWSR